MRAVAEEVKSPCMHRSGAEIMMIPQARLLSLGEICCFTSRNSSIGACGLHIADGCVRPQINDEFKLYLTAVSARTVLEVVLLVRGRRVGMRRCLRGGGLR